VITHLVVAKPRSNLSAGDRQAFVQAVEQALLHIPTVRAVRIGRRVTHGALYERTPPAADFLILIDFDDLAGLQMYLRHPAHEAVSAQFSRLLEWGLVYDFETGDLARLRELAELERDP
jgi:stress responsive alpha/beta barrel protein